MGINTNRVAGGLRQGPVAVRPFEQARISRKFECPTCGKFRPKSWRVLARWLDKDRQPHEQEMCRKCWQSLMAQAEFV